MVSTNVKAGAVSYVPIVATALKRPFAMRSISSSICCSVDAGELRIAYVDGGTDDVDGAGCCWDGAGGVGGSRENNDGEGHMKDRYWSMTCEITVSIHPTIGNTTPQHLFNLIPSTRTRDFSGQLLQQSARQRLNKVEMERLVKRLVQVLCYALDVGKGRRHEVYSRYIRQRRPR